MENFGNYIFLIFIIFIFILNTFLAARKSKLAKEQASNLPDNDSLEQIEGENEEGEKWFSEENRIERPLVRETRKTVETKHHGYQSLFDLQEKENPKKPITSTNTFTKNGTNKIRLDSIEEAKRAFIYSEIFNRKY